MAVPYQYGSWRTHDRQEVSWRGIQPTKGTYTGSGSDQANMVLDWSDFDTRLTEAQGLGVSIVFMMWLTPSWASIAGDQVGGSNTVIGPWGVAGESAVPSNFQYVKDIVTAILQRANGGGTRKIKYLEILNEPEFYDAGQLATFIGGGGKPFWTGTAIQAVTYAWAAYSAAKAADPGIIVLSPSQYDQTRLTSFLTATDPISGKKGHECFDYINIHPYTTTPNKSMNKGIDLYWAGGSRIGVAAAKRLNISAGGTDKPVVATEWGIETAVGTETAAFAALTTAQRKTYILRILAAGAREGLPLFTIFSNSSIAGDYTNDTDGVIAAVTEFQQKVPGRTIIGGGSKPDGSEVLIMSDGTVHIW